MSCCCSLPYINPGACINCPNNPYRQIYTPPYCPHIPGVSPFIPPVLTEEQRQKEYEKFMEDLEKLMEKRREK